MLTSRGFSLCSPHLFSLPRAVEEKGEALGGLRENGASSGDSQPGFLGQEGNRQRKCWDGGDSSLDVLGVLRVAEGSEALGRNPREGLRVCQAP